VGRGRPVDGGLEHELRHERHHRHTAVGGQPFQHVVGDVARVVADRAGGGVREDHRRGGGVQRVPHGGGGDVGEVDQHAEPVHLPHDLAAERGQAARPGLVGRRVGPVHVVVVGERQIAHAEVVQPPQGAQGVGDRVAALRAHQGGDAAVRPGRLHVGGGQRGRQVLGVTVQQLPYAVDLFEGGGDGVRLVRAD